MFKKIISIALSYFYLSALPAIGTGIIEQDKITRMKSNLYNSSDLANDAVKYFKVSLSYKGTCIHNKREEKQLFDTISEHYRNGMDDEQFYMFAKLHFFYGKHINQAFDEHHLSQKYINSGQNFMHTLLCCDETPYNIKGKVRRFLRYHYF